MYHWYFLGADCKTLHQLYTALIRPILEYGCEAFDSASSTIKQKIDSIQYQALTICTGAIHSSPLYRLQTECGDPPLYLRRQFLCNLYGVKINTHNTHPNEYINSDNWQKHYFADKWSSTAHKTPFEARISHYPYVVFPLNDPLPFWHYSKPSVSTEILSRVADATNTCDKRNISTEIINTIWMNSLHIYTDGSRNPTLDTVGCGVYIPQLKYTKATRLNNEVSIFTAELFAILLAVEWVE